MGRKTYKYISDIDTDTDRSRWRPMLARGLDHWSWVTLSQVSTLMGDRQGSPSAVHLCPIVGVDHNLWPTVLSCWYGRKSIRYRYFKVFRILYYKILQKNYLKYFCRKYWNVFEILRKYFQNEETQTSEGPIVSTSLNKMSDMVWLALVLWFSYSI